MSLIPGFRLGPYEIQSPLGAGGMGEVYRATDNRLDRTVAASRIAIGANVGTGGALSRVQYAVASDGQRFLLNTTAADNATSPITIVLNWDMALRRLAPTN